VGLKEGNAAVSNIGKIKGEKDFFKDL